LILADGLPPRLPGAKLSIVPVERHLTPIVTSGPWPRQGNARRPSAQACRLSRKRDFRAGPDACSHAAAGGGHLLRASSPDIRIPWPRDGARRCGVLAKAPDDGPGRSML